ncbi:MAG: hypothetical protein KatS3mg108_1899 [Isosphaeraceae bacterium]|nr:MAG: hypothetical protein KatS3mg108_1899 [Isosphaeraceae bacterium]
MPHPVGGSEFDWRRYPEAASALRRWVEAGITSNPFAATLARRMRDETGTRLVDWLDHVVIHEAAVSSLELEGWGFERDWETTDPEGGLVFRHAGGMFPRVVTRPKGSAAVLELAVKVESVAEFARAHDLGPKLEGYAFGPYRVARVAGTTSLAAVERRATRTLDPWDGELARSGRLAPHAARDALAARDLWTARRRGLPDEQAALCELDELLDRVLELCHGSRDLACHLVFEAERAFWQSRNRAARVQKARQDRLGLGWANHDHHTFRCSRAHFPRIMSLFRRLGFETRERFHAGAEAGWGAQILEHPVTGIVIFADLDLAPDELAVDFTRQPLPELERPATVGLWVALHGESLLAAGLHHLEAQFDFDAARTQLAAEGIETMPPFSDFPFLRQAFTVGERWPVRVDRLAAARQRGWISADQKIQFESEGALGSHLEILERNDGFKGFNQAGVSAILAATDPRRRAVHPT